ncbi:thiol-disulfide isomerase/thioredoxin [Kibdelosporangium banguiense]|uniref:Thiol-disulfide isomerase/thioredoxin n=1 Tax=Kibdelosporangium banguiense TaxID=1365924 RepID=A0ABS4TDL6_9PSEU|nr:thioredoxin family protein [Kibdelosporangium banguiense]MBP2322160.1 thiol-disulfide isomerase/thioredoxin [Kibdelosporangium banguiense]
MTGVWVLIGTLALASVFGLAWRSSRGRVRTAKSSSLPSELQKLVDPGSAVTLLQISTTFCAPCRHTRILLADLAGRTEGLQHVDFDVTDHPEVAQSLGVLSTPTTLAVDAQGVELMRVGGVPKRDTLLDALRPHLP